MKLNVKDIIAVFTKYAFYIILIIIGTGFIAVLFESADYIKTSSAQIFKTAVYAVCFAPAVSVILFVILNVIKKDWKSSLMGTCLAAALLISFFIKNTG